jgi:Ni/Co efflux regulator RcnB
MKSILKAFALVAALALPTAAFAKDDKAPAAKPADKKDTDATKKEDKTPAAKPGDKKTGKDKDAAKTGDTMKKGGDAPAPKDAPPAEKK